MTNIQTSSQPTKPEVLRYAAFTDNGKGGNPAGIVLDARGLSTSDRLGIAGELGYSETVYLEPTQVLGEYDVRYFSPLGEVAFCGHATVAAAVALAEREGARERVFRTRSGRVEVTTHSSSDGIAATLTSVPTRTRSAEGSEIDAALRALRWAREDLDPIYPPHVAYAGNEHLILAAKDRDHLARLDYDYRLLGALMAQRGWTTLQLVYAHSPSHFSARDPFPPGGVVKDPATGAAAAALGGYLRALALVDLPADVIINQGVDMGRPSRLVVNLRDDEDRVRVTGLASVTDEPAIPSVTSGSH